MKEYPTKWEFVDEQNWIHRYRDDGEGEIWCEFVPGMQPEDDEIEWLLEKLNEECVDQDQLLHGWNCECLNCHVQVCGDGTSCGCIDDSKKMGP